MRRVAVVLAAFGTVLSACASPAIRLATHFTTAEKRVYHLVSEVVTRTDVPAAQAVERIRLEAEGIVEVTSTDQTGTKLKVTITPKKFIRNGKADKVPEVQAALVSVSPDGEVTNVLADGTTPVALGGAADDLGTLIGAEVARGRVHLGERWRRAITSDAGPGSQSVRVAALRFEQGYRCAVVEVATRRPATRMRQAAGQNLSLDGIEVAATDIAFAIDQGFPVRITGDGEGRFSVAGVAAGQSAVVITTHTELTLLHYSPGGKI